MDRDFTSPACRRITEIFDEYTARFHDYLSALNRDMHALKKRVMELLAHQDKSPSKPPERPWTAIPMVQEECEVVNRRAPSTASEDSTDSSWGIANAHPLAQQRALPEVACLRRERHAPTSATPPASSGRGSGHAEGVRRGGHAISAGIMREASKACVPPAPCSVQPVEGALLTTGLFVDTSCDETGDTSVGDAAHCTSSRRSKGKDGVLPSDQRHLRRFYSHEDDDSSGGLKNPPPARGGSRGRLNDLPPDPGGSRRGWSNPSPDRDEGDGPLSHLGGRRPPTLPAQVPVQPAQPLNLRPGFKVEVKSGSVGSASGRASHIAQTDRDGSDSTEDDRASRREHSRHARGRDHGLSSELRRQHRRATSDDDSGGWHHPPPCRGEGGGSDPPSDDDDSGNDPLPHAPILFRPEAEVQGVSTWEHEVDSQLPKLVDLMEKLVAVLESGGGQ